jgi:hypothetical protein
MDDVYEQLGIATTRDLHKHIACHHLESLGDARRLHQRLRGDHDMGQVKEDAAEVRICLQDRRH